MRLIPCLPRKFLCPTLVALALLLLAGCGGSSSTTSGNNQAGNSTAPNGVNADDALAQAHNTRVRGRLKKFQVQYNLFQMEHEGAPATFDDIQAAADPKDVFADDRIGKDIPFTFLPPSSTADDMDLLAHTDPDGPLPILGVKLNGQVVDFPTVEDFQKHIDWQNSHPAPRSRPDPDADGADPSLAPADPDAR